MDEFYTVAKTADVPEGEGRAFSVAVDFKHLFPFYLYNDFHCGFL